MALSALFEALEAIPFARDIRESAYLFPTLETAHVVALAVVVGSIVIVDVRLLGAASKGQPVTAISKQYLPWTWAAFVFAAVTGGLLFISRATSYVALTEFSAKFVVMGLAGLNMLVFHFMTYRTVKSWDLGPTPMGAKVAAGLSLVFWTSIVFLGRKVGFHL